MKTYQICSAAFLLLSAQTIEAKFNMSGTPDGQPVPDYSRLWTMSGKDAPEAGLLTVSSMMAE